MTETAQPVWGSTNPEIMSDKVQRFGSVIGLKPDMEQRYRELHAEVWPNVIRRIKQSNIRNYSIYITEIEDKKYLFSYFEYIGNDYDNDMRAIANDPVTQAWWKETDPCQRQLPSRREGDSWSLMERVFFN
ncbi:L-rhamnose mutarotase [Microbulbifer sp. 2304DJ12-6]|uniref:L-rhamnose mutarotase n=1 Tax=Microbulbifer sp. 2304DJ12-6 TaxID=3233340 RepID=UPI0039AFA9D0